MEFFNNTLFPNISGLILISLIIFLSQIIYSSIGFGSGMFAISLFTLFYGNIDYFVPFFILVCLPTEIFISIKDRKLINYKKTWYFLLTIFPPLLLGSYLLKKAENVWLMITLGLIIILLSLYHLFLETKFTPKLKNHSWVIIFGALSGILGGLFGMSGPPLIFYFKSIKLNKYQFRVALMSIFLFMTIMRITFYSTLGLFSSRILLSSLLMIPIGLLGLFTGNILHNLIPEKKFKDITSMVLLISGILIIIKNIL